MIKSSGNLKTDKAALEAVKLASPFRPLPADFKGESVDVQFILIITLWELQLINYLACKVRLLCQFCR